MAGDGQYDNQHLLSEVTKKKGMGMEEIGQRMFSVESEQENMGISIEALQRQRAEDREVLLQLRDDVKAVKEIVTAWNNIKGFVQTVKAINKFLWVTTKIIAVIAAGMFAIYLFGKTGNWTWPVEKP